MQRKTLLASAVSLLLAGSAAFAYAQDATPAAPPAPSANVSRTAPPAPGQHPGPKWGQGGPGGDHGSRGDHGRGDGDDKGRWGHHGRGPEDGGVIGDLRSLERIYVMTGRAKDLPALYNEVLAKSQNPRVRDYAYEHLARAQMAPASPDAAIATLKKSLDENLAQDQKRHQEMEAFKQQRMQDRAAKSAGAK